MNLKIFLLRKYILFNTTSYHHKNWSVLLKDDIFCNKELDVNVWLLVSCMNLKPL